MIKKIQSFFEAQFGLNLVTPQEQRHQLNLAVAAVFMEMMLIDHQIASSEQKQLELTLSQQLDLDTLEVHELIHLARQTLNDSADYYQFTRLINDRFGRPEKIAVIENLWKIAFADGRLDQHEEHYLRKVADLLHVPHSEFIKAKIRNSPQ